MAPRTWTDYDLALVGHLKAQGLTPFEIYTRMPGRGYESVRSAYHRDNAPYDPETRASYRNKLGDLAFKKAVISAVNNGLERASFGVVRGNTYTDDFRPTHFTPMPTLSLLGSPALSCADFA